MEYGLGLKAGESLLIFGDCVSRALTATHNAPAAFSR